MKKAKSPREITNVLKRNGLVPTRQLKKRVEVTKQKIFNPLL